jgi:acyl-CoA synthetase (AMP-forming)/AMP-acid ligase II
VGEIWISSVGVPLGFIGPEESANALVFNAVLPGVGGTFIKTGDLGFLWPDLTRPDREPFLYYLSSMEQVIQANGLDHFQCDVEQTIQKSHANIAPEGCVVLQVNHVVVVVVQPLSATEQHVLATIPSILSAVADVHQFIPDKILFVPEIRKSRFGEKQRDRIRHMVASSSLRMIYEFSVQS